MLLGRYGAPQRPSPTGASSHRTSPHSRRSKVFSSKRETEHLTKNAYASLVRMILRPCADSGSFFSVWDAYRSFDEQVAMLKKYYCPSSSGDRTYVSQKWARRSGRPRTASPGYSNHGNGVAVDIHPGPIQDWMRGNAARFG